MHRYMRCIYNQETITKGIFEVFVGMQVDIIEGVPVELLVKVLPSTDYAVFTLEGEDIVVTTDIPLAARCIEGPATNRPVRIQTGRVEIIGEQDAGDGIRSSRSSHLEFRCVRGAVRFERGQREGEPADTFAAPLPTPQPSSLRSPSPLRSCSTCRTSSATRS